MIMVNFSVSITLSTPAMKRLMAEAEKEGKEIQQKVREIVQERYEEKGESG